MRQRRPRAFTAAIVALGVCVVAAATVTDSTSPATTTHGWPDGCPRNARTEFAWPTDVVAVTQAVRSQVPRVFANLTSMGRPAWHHVQLKAVIDLGGQPAPGWLHRIRGLDYYRAAATRACGKEAMLSSMLALLYFPECQLPCAPQFAFATATRARWYLWTSYRI
jgi:hypothetical protein